MLQTDYKLWNGKLKCHYYQEKIVIWFYISDLDFSLTQSNGWGVSGHRVGGH